MRNTPAGVRIGQRYSHFPLAWHVGRQDWTSLVSLEDKEGIHLALAYEM